MKHRWGLGLTLAICAAVDAAEPPATSSSPPPAPASATRPTPAIKPPAKLLDLRVGDVRNYMMPNEYRAALTAPDAEKNTVVVEGRREVLPVESGKPIPVGPLVPLWWGLTHPAESWRIFLPDVNRPAEGPREPEDKVPPPIFRWGP
jgi:hypothetical protein